jgi:hypothetical protein
MPFRRHYACGFAAFIFAAAWFAATHAVTRFAFEVSRFRRYADAAATHYARLPDIFDADYDIFASAISLLAATPLFSFICIHVAFDIAAISFRQTLPPFRFHIIFDAGFAAS